MRARSNTLYCDSLEGYIELAKSTTSYITSRQPRSQSKKPSAKIIEKHYKEVIPDDDNTVQSNLTKTEQNPAFLDDWLDFDFTPRSNLNKDQLNPELSNDTIDTDYSDRVEAAPKEGSVVRKVMVIGLDGTGKHSLINTAFNCGLQSLENQGRVLDLLTKTEQDEDREVRYKFWIQNLKCGADKFKKQFKEMAKIYYKNVSLFVFMYSATDRQSLICLEDAIKAVLKEVPAEKFNGVLVGTKSDLTEQREVNFCDAAALQEQFGLNSLIETTCNDKNFKRVLSEVIEKTEEDSEDGQTNRRVSILSMD